MLKYPNHIIDFEASALGNQSYPIQVAVVLESGEHYSAYILPTDEWLENFVWDENSFRIHGIPVRLLKDVGKPPLVVAQELNEFLGDQFVFCDGGHHDLYWCDTLFAAAGIVRTFHIMDIVECLCGGYNGVAFWRAKQIANDALKLREHDALNDVKILQLAARTYVDPQFINKYCIKPFC